MSKCAVQTFTKFDGACRAALAARLQTEIPEPAPGSTGTVSGAASRAGFTLAWTYEVAAEVLTVQCTESPFLVPCAAIEPQLRKWVMACYPVAPDASGG